MITALNDTATTGISFTQEEADALVAGIVGAFAAA